MLRIVSFFQGFGFLRNMTIFPHFGAKLGLEACQKAVDENSGLVGLGIDNDAAAIIQNGHIEIVGKGEAAVLVKDKSVRKFNFRNSTFFRFIERFRICSSDY
jgi:cyanophycinase-like exopeptidase